ncbi:MAG: hypothetical protein AAF604_09815 [Acidobacteriota bacterium]
MAWSSAATQEAFELTLGVVVDPADGALYAMRPEGGLEKISLASGSVLWTSDEADQPVALDGDRLVAQVIRPGALSRLHVVLLDAAAGRLEESFSVTLPAGVRATLDEAIGRRFELTSRRSTGKLELVWTQTERYAQGVAPGAGAPPETLRRGALQWDRQAGELVAVENAPPAPAWPPSVEAWRAAGRSAVGPVAAGVVIAATEVVGGQTAPDSRIILKRWQRSGGEPLPDHELFRGPHLLQFPSADGRHLLVTQRHARGEAEEYEWSLLSLETGESVGRLRHRQAHSPFFVDDDHVVLIERPFGRRSGEEWEESPRRLHAIVLGSGSSVWERTLRSTQLRGPMPP